jgi:diguanylate cyclase (GGDEF)-like protein
MGIDKLQGLNPAASRQIFKDLNKPLSDTEEIPVCRAANKIFDENQQHLQELEKYKNESLVDALTGCYNRNYFEKFKKDNFDPNRDHNHLGLIFIDLNGLKKINNTLGHAAGDKLIKNNAVFLKVNLRRKDLVVRFGGDEFVIICHNQQNDDNFEAILTARMSYLRDLKAKDPDTPISFAFGVAVYDQVRDSKDIEETQKLADRRMYQDKAVVKSKKKLTFFKNEFKKKFF